MMNCSSQEAAVMKICAIFFLSQIAAFGGIHVWMIAIVWKIQSLISCKDSETNHFHLMLEALQLIPVQKILSGQRCQCLSSQ